MASIRHFSQSYITNLYDKQKKKKMPADWGGGGRAPVRAPPPPRSYATGQDEWKMRTIFIRCRLTHDGLKRGIMG